MDKHVRATPKKVKQRSPPQTPLPKFNPLLKSLAKKLLLRKL